MARTAIADHMHDKNMRVRINPLPLRMPQISL
jgi:hypothetical protein